MVAVSLILSMVEYVGKDEEHMGKANPFFPSIKVRRSATFRDAFSGGTKTSFPV